MVIIMRLRYISDLHLEFMSDDQVSALLQKLVPSAASDMEVLVLAGDIGNPFRDSYRVLMEHVNKHFLKTFVVAGNHEYYGHGKTVEVTNSRIENVVAAFPRISFLNNKTEWYNNVVFVGTTLWSEIKQPQFTINDTKAIVGMTVAKYQALHQEARQFLESVLPSNNNVVVITHHMPSYHVMDPKYQVPPWTKYNQWFASDFDQFIIQYQDRLRCWIYGHTHVANQSNLHNVHMLCNPLGYSHETSTVNYNATIDLSNISHH